MVGQRTMYTLTNSVFWMTSVCFDFDRRGSSYRGYKYKRNDLKGTKKSLRGSRRFEISQVRVTGGKMTVSISSETS